MEQDTHFSPSQEQNPLSGALSSLLSNPEMMGRIRSMMEQMSSNQPNTDPPATSVSTDSQAALSADGLASVLGNPELMAKLPQIMSALGPMLSSTAVNTGKSSPPRERSAEDCRNDLLLALKPFLSPERCQAIDTLLRISKLGTVLRRIK